MLLHFDVYLEVKMPCTSKNIDAYNLLEEAKKTSKELYQYKEQVHLDEIIEILKIHNKIQAMLHQVELYEHKKCN